jgi:hypothetical protein
VTQKEKILLQASKWRDAGVSTYACKVELGCGFRPFPRNFIEITQEILENPSIFSENYNFLAIDLENSQLACLDIEGYTSSVNNFMSFLKEKSLNIEDFIVEKTPNNGLHIYFRNSNDRKKQNIFAMELKSIKFDMLYRGKVFTFPSYLGEKTYAPMYNIEGKVNKDKIVDIPTSIYDMFCKRR